MDKYAANTNGRCFQYYVQVGLTDKGHILYYYGVSQIDNSTDVLNQNRHVFMGCNMHSKIHHVAIARLANTASH